MSKQIWRPDTCACVFEQEYDYSTKPQTLVSTKALTVCPFHNGDHDLVLDENQTKNKVLGKIIELHPELTVDIIEKGQVVGRELKDTIEYKWSYDQNRNLEVEFVGVDKQVSPIDATIAQEFPGKNIVVK
jgi:hypothetical protein